jgi:hypothetical protein
VISALIGLLAGWLFSKQSSDELHHVAHAMAVALEEAGLATFPRDSRGRSYEQSAAHHCRHLVPGPAAP